jgi:hypothetical protein
MSCHGRVDRHARVSKLGSLQAKRRKPHATSERQALSKSPYLKMLWAGAVDRPTVVWGL